MQIPDGAAAARTLAELMVADAPRPEYADAFRPFAPLIGSWDLDVAWYDESGATTRTTKGEWHFAWALDGRAVADIWITPSRAARATDGDGEWGLSVRIYDPELQAFRSTWMGPKAAFVMPFVAHATADTITLESQTANTRWAFTDITAGAFHWRNEDIDADGNVILRQTFVATRQA
ncbi:hypothetical protein [Kribbella sindirgiensis]|uniref:DUF1579 domain-containing protein n=1 Tax=Kribbella sindirgiensis TaxID=1124744 RepID=A0A4R0ILV4_9ACTN|nr:hypothetical protein [Kribbella sindirgiensis]TCC32296.1 hypothetical protein E0H50_19025 [Kribbella sindirgiensis]